MPNKILMTVLLFVVALLGLASSAVATPAKLSGVLEWRYGAHTATENGSKVLDASHFTQQYSFLAEKSGLLSNGRLGKYDLALGYEWSWVDSKRGNGVDIAIDNPLDNILYRGDIKLAPGGLPFNMHAFSYDMHNISLVAEDLGELFSTRGSSDVDGTITDIMNGSNRVTGMTLQAGVANGHYEGKYRNALATLPRLLIDFRQNDVFDKKSLRPRDYTDRDLAFVSLNKKNNWFHYKFFTHEDRINPNENLQEQTFLLGTIDHRQRRQWVNLTNWIKVSADISYSETLPEASVTSLEYQKRYDVNLFTKAQRTRWQGSNFTTYSRVSDETSFDKSLFVPLYGSGELNRDTSWRVRMLGSTNSRELYSGVVDRESGHIYASAQVDTFRQARYIFSPTVAAESKQGTDGEGHAVSAGAEFHNNSRYRTAYDLSGRYEARLFNGTGQTGQAVDYLEQMIDGRLAKDINSRLRGGLSQLFWFASGTYDSTVADYISADSDALINHTSAGDGSVFRSLSTLSLDHRTLFGLNNRVELVYDYQTSPTLSGQQVQLNHRLDYRKKAWSVISDSRLGYGDELATTSISLGAGAKDFFSNTTTLTYRPSRVVRADIALGYDHRTYTNASALEHYSVKERLEYALWQHKGLVRQLAVFGQEFEWVKGLQGAESVGENYRALTLFTNYYPTRISLLSAKLRYETDSSSDNDTLLVFLTAGLDFQKLKLSLDYSYGDRTASGLLAARNENRWEVKAKKMF